MKQAHGRGRAAAITALTAALTLTLAAGTAQASPGDEIVGYPGPDGLIWIPELAGSSGFVSGGLAPWLDTFITFGCAGGGTIEVAFHLENHPDRDPAPFTVDCPESDPARVTVPLGTGLRGGFQASVTASAPATRWGATVVQPE
ncbi:hypothetical protein OHA91_27650 [Streptomyces erythrochromogenes]|uniref:Secreted protein n=1 Tax=Streptomyces erythrochromogenes TaxID=285574 RepID=A0ABZ1QH03_9ACTN|nr:hypothetical protein [Streptomyces erythrochromogenes]MCX5587333.1 hypothetical protein [Streptomyces erythrochromogenes]